ncbi:MAG: hypothetical protein HZB15_16905, partial [Actinobacteria bacterium]|nr:hypothetical protein [Actinomycetota bacterium]
MRSSRRQFLARTAQLGVLLGGGIPILQSCGGDDDDDAGSSDGTSAPTANEGTEEQQPIADGMKPEAGPLRIFNYPDYVNP